MLRGISKIFPTAAGHLVMAKNVQNVRLDPGRVRLDLELYFGAWRWLGSRVCIFLGGGGQYFSVFLMPTVSVGYKKCLRRLKKNVSRLKKFVLGLKKNFQNLNFENLKISESQIF